MGPPNVFPEHTIYGHSLPHAVPFSACPGTMELPETAHVFARIPETHFRSAECLETKKIENIWPSSRGKGGKVQGEQKLYCGDNL